MQQARGFVGSSSRTQYQAARTLHRHSLCQRHVQQQRCSSTAAHALPPQVLVVGVGGSASETVGQLWDSEAVHPYIPGHLIINTDVQELTNTFMPDSCKLLIGTKWAGTNGDQLLGQDAAFESSEEISGALEGADVVFVLASTAGGTGGGAAHVVADLAKQQGAVTISVAIQPAEQQQQQQAHQHRKAPGRMPADCQVSMGTQQLRLGGQTLDGVLPHMPISCCVQGIAGLLQGYESLSVEELQAAVSGRSSALGFAVAQGPESLMRAVCAALSTPQCAPLKQHVSAVLCFVAGADDVLEVQAEDVRDVISSQCSSAAAVHVRPVLASDDDLPAGCIAVTVLMSSPLLLQQQQQQLAEGLDGGGGSSGSSAAPTTRSNQQTVGDVAEAPSAGDAGDGGGDVVEGEGLKSYHENTE